MNLTKFEFSPLSFSDKPVIENKLWEIVEDINCNMRISNNEHFNYTLLKGFQTNYRSGPKRLDRLAPKFGSNKMKICWMIHDANYEGYLSKKNADKLLYYMLINTELPAKNSEIVYIGLRMFGMFAYNTKKANKFVKFKHEIIPIDEVTSGKTRGMLNESIKLENQNPLIENTELLFDNKNKIDVSKELKQIAEEINFDFNQIQVDQYYK